MIRARGALLMILALWGATVPPCRALLSPGSIRRTGVQRSGRGSPNVSKIASWRGGAVDVGGDRPPRMSAQLGLVRAAGYGIIAGSLCLKTPQIARVWSAKSLVGLAPASIYADVFLFATSVMYHVLKGNPIRAYGESVIILVQTMIMVGLMWRYGVDEISSTTGVVAKKRRPGGGPLGRVAIVLGSLAATALTMQYLPESMWGLLVILSTPTILVVNLPQIWKNHRQSHTGELAQLTVMLGFAGSAIRTWTTLADLGGDRWLLFNYLLGVVTNATLLMQIWAYRARTAEVRRAVKSRARGGIAPAA